jgi:hypothetical protein
VYIHDARLFGYEGCEPASTDSVRRALKKLFKGFLQAMQTTYNTSLETEWLNVAREVGNSSVAFECAHAVSAFFDQAGLKAMASWEQRPSPPPMPAPKSEPAQQPVGSGAAGEQRPSPPPMPDHAQHPASAGDVWGQMPPPPPPKSEPAQQPVGSGAAGEQRPSPPPMPDHAQHPAGAGDVWGQMPPPPPPMPDMQVIGKFCRFRNLISHPELNGVYCFIQAETVDRWLVQTEKQDEFR